MKDREGGGGSWWGFLVDTRFFCDFSGFFIGFFGVELGGTADGGLLFKVHVAGQFTLNSNPPSAVVFYFIFGFREGGVVFWSCWIVPRGTIFLLGGGGKSCGIWRCCREGMTMRGEKGRLAPFLTFGEVF